jgi:hypothetical protein
MASKFWVLKGVVKLHMHGIFVHLLNRTEFTFIHDKQC